MKRLIPIFILAVFSLLGMGEVACANDLRVTVTCPVAVSAGSPLNVNVLVKNPSEREPVKFRKSRTRNGTKEQPASTSVITFNRVIALLAGNSGGSLGALGIFGPFNRNVGSISLGPGESTSFSVQINSSVPIALQGKVATASVMIYSDDGQILEGNACFVPVN